MQYYTLQVHYGSTKEPSIEEIKDLFAGDGLNEMDWKRTLRETLYKSGFTIQHTNGAVEFISPLRIYTAFLIKQDKKFAV